MVIFSKKYGGNLYLNVFSSSHVFFALIFTFFTFKLSHLFIPYYWDELGVYAKAALYMYDNDITLLPGVIPADLSRGHPLLCAAIFAIFFTILGPHVWVGHLVALLISCLLLIFLFVFGKNIFGHKITALAVILLMVQPIFITQSSMVLPEIMLACFSIAALFSYMANRLIALAIFSTLAILVKETAIALPASIFLIEFVSALMQRSVDKKSINAVLAASAPLITWGVFLVYQRFTEGWFFFPLHTDYISFSFNQIISRISYYLSFIFKGQGRYLWALILSVYFILIYVNRRPCHPGNTIQNIRNALRNKHPYYILFIYVVFGLLVSMLNFHLARYTIFIFPAVCILISATFFTIFQITGLNKIMPLFLVPLILIPFFYYKSNTFSFDADMGYLHVVKTQREVSEYLNENYTQSINIMSSFPINLGLVEPRAGYTDKVFSNISSSCKNLNQSDAVVYIYTLPGNLESCNPKKNELSLVKKFNSSFSKALVYRKPDKNNLQ